MVKIKMCGFTDPGDVRAACSLGVDMVGTVLVQGSPRSVPIERAGEVLSAASPGVARVAVFIPRGPEDVEEVYRRLQPDLLQFHLTFPADELLEIRGDLDAEIIAVVPVPRQVDRHAEILDRAVELAEVADFILLDTKGPTGGGTGLTHDWGLSAAIRDALDKPVFLAGGLNPSNVGRAIEVVRPYGVDVATGVESCPGRKDLKLIRDFVEAVRRAERVLEQVPG